jgi:hypothetical protein
MKLVRWMGIGLVVTFLVAGATVAIPGAAAGIHQFLSPSAGMNPSGGSPQPNWNSGNLCTPSVVGGNTTCVNLVSQSAVPLWYNFSAGEFQGGNVTISIFGSSDCINLNFHSFYTNIVLILYGSTYSCPASSTSGAPVGSGPGVNVAINSEGDTFTLEQLGSVYSTNVTIYGTTTFVSDIQAGSGLVTTVTYIGTTAGFGTCPSGITSGRVMWSEVSYGSYNTFNTIFVNGMNVMHPPANSGYATYPLLPPDGASFGTGNMYGNETTQALPPGTCSYLGV